MNKKINIEVNGSIIGLNLNEFWYFHYYLKNYNLVQKGLSLFSKMNAKAYMTLLD